VPCLDGCFRPLDIVSRAKARSCFICAVLVSSALYAYFVLFMQSGIMLSREKVFVKNTVPGFINRLRMM
jgi:hypothetical protein